MSAFLVQLIWWSYCINADCPHRITTFNLLECSFFIWIHDQQAYVGAYIGLYQISTIDFFAKIVFLQKNGSENKKNTEEKKQENFDL